MNKLNHKNIVEYVDNRQEKGNHLDVELVDTDDINCLPLLIMSYYVCCQFVIVDWMNK